MRKLHTHMLLTSLVPMAAQSTAPSPRPSCPPWPRLLRLLLLLAMLLLPGLARADATGRIGGFVVIDATGDGIGAARLTIRSKSLIGGAQSVNSADDGSYIFQNLPPGVYELTAAIEGFDPVKQRNIVVNANQQSAVDIRLQISAGPSADKPYQIIEKQNPVLNLESAATVTVLNNKPLTRAPNFRQEKAVAQLTPGVSSGTDRVSVRGGLARSTRYLVDGMDVTDVVGGGLGSSALINFDAVEQYAVFAGGMDAEYNSLGLVQNMVTRSGGNKLTIDASVILQPAAFSATNRYPGRAPLQDGQLLYDDRPLPDRAFYSGNLNIGGPIIKDRLWFFTSFQFNFNRLTYNVPGIEWYPGLEKDYDRFQDQTLYLGRAKLTWQATRSTRISLSFNLDRNFIGNAIGSSAINLSPNDYAPEAERQVARGGEVVVLTWDTALTPKLLLQVQGGFTTKRFAEDTLATRNGAPDHLTPGHILNTGDLYNNLSYINGTRDWLTDDRINVQFAPSLLYTMQALGTHNMKGGLQFSYMRYGRTAGVPGGYRYTDKAYPPAGPCDPAQPASYGACNRREEFPDSLPQNGAAGAGFSTVASAINFGAFVQDRWTIGRWLTVVPGFRVDVGVLYAGDNKLAQMVGYGPRISFIYDLLHDRTTLVRLHYGRHNDVGNAFVADRGNPLMAAKLYEWNSATSQFDKLIRTTGGSGGQRFDDSPSPPKLDEVSVGVQREVFAQTVVGVDYTFRSYRNLWVNEEINQIWDPAGLRVIGNVDGQAGQRVFLARAPDEAQRTYHGLDLWAQGTPGNFSIIASYTLAFVNGTVLDYFDSTGYLLNPRQTPLFDGPMPDNYRHFLKGMVNYDFDIGFHVGLRFQYRTGAPQWQSFRSPEDQQFNLYRSPRGTSTGTSTNNPLTWAEFRLPDQFPIDLQVGYSFEKLFKQRLDLMVMFFNVLNVATPFAIDTRDGPTFGQATRRPDNFFAEVVVRYRY